MSSRNKKAADRKKAVAERMDAEDEMQRREVHAQHISPRTRARTAQISKDRELQFPPANSINTYILS